MYKRIPNELIGGFSDAVIVDMGEDSTIYISGMVGHDSNMAGRLSFLMAVHDFGGRQSQLKTGFLDLDNAGLGPAARWRGETGSTPHLCRQARRH
jgi:hypothetical protein